jgi:hypothetical protein
MILRSVTPSEYHEYDDLVGLIALEALWDHDHHTPSQYSNSLPSSILTSTSQSESTTDPTSRLFASPYTAIPQFPLQCSYCCKVLIVVQRRRH